MSSYLKDINVEGKICVLGAGKAAATMAAEVHKQFGDACHGIVVTRYGHGENIETGNIKVLEASHPVPDEEGAKAARAILDYAHQCDSTQLVIFLISGGGSALMPLPVEGVTFEEKSNINKFLLASGASIAEINVVRKSLSRIKGGGLVRAVAPASTISLIISDVVGDNPALIASGPTVIDQSTNKQALDILNKYNWTPISSIEQYLSKIDSATDELSDADHQIHIIASAKLMLDAAASQVQDMGWDVEILSYDTEGEAREVAKQHAEIALNAKKQGKRCILLSGGELTVTISNSQGAGGPNQEYLLALAIYLQGESGISALACDSDGVDGTQDNAGAFIDASTIERANSLSMNPEEYLQDNKSYDFFSKLENLVVTGPTGTNVNDFRAIVIEPDE